MTKTTKQGSIGAMLDEYQKAIVELQKVLSDLSDVELCTIVFKDAVNPNCKSIQTILSHVIRSGYAYAIYIRKYKNMEGITAPSEFHSTIAQYNIALTNIFNFTDFTFDNILESEVEELDNSKKITSSWGQIYDIEQIMEHAIVHILKHRRQIEKFKIALRN